MLASRMITQWTILDWRHATVSNHEMIKWKFRVDQQEEEDHTWVIG